MPHLRIKRGPINFYLAFTWSRRVRGVNSNLSDGSHVLFWDFDASPLEDVTRALARVQATYELGPIVIMHTNAPGHYHAYCLSRQRHGRALSIIGDTPGVDRFFLAFGVIRGFWTLRFTPKGTREISLAGILPGVGMEWDTDWTELTSGVEYWTKQI